MEKSAGIDWISVTVKHNAAHDLDGRIVLADDYTNGFETIKPKNGYNRARQYQSGAIVQWHEEHLSMGIHVTYTSKAIAKACIEFGLSQYEVLESLAYIGKVTRLDVAFDVKNTPIDIRTLYQQMLDGTIKTRAKSFDYVESAKAGNEFGARTAYVGSMTKRKKLLRVYDKGMQLKLDDYLTRFELETHGQLANNAAHQLLDAPSMGETIAGMITGYADFSESIVANAFEDVSAVKISHPVYKKSDTARWLVDVVSKTLAKECLLDDNLYSEFNSMFQFHLSQLLAERQYHDE